MAKVWLIEKGTFQQYVSESETWMELVRKCGYKNPHNRVTVRKRVEQEGLSTSHFLGMAWKKNRRVAKRTLEEVLVKGSSYRGNHLKKRLIANRHFKPECSSCHLSEWLGKPINLEMDHINGDNSDHRLDNLRLLCPNCHSYTDNYKGKNCKRILSEKPDIKTCISCGVEIHKTSTRCKSCASTEANKVNRKVLDRPSLKILQEDVKALGYLGTGRKYGVSDSCIKKWIKVYEKHK